jgi:hypothetical protein
MGVCCGDAAQATPTVDPMSLAIARPKPKLLKLFGDFLNADSCAIASLLALAGHSYDFEHVD